MAMRRGKHRRSYSKRRRTRYNAGSSRYVYLVVRQVSYEGDTVIAVLGTRQQAEAVRSAMQHGSHPSDYSFIVETWRVGEITKANKRR